MAEDFITAASEAGIISATARDLLLEFASSHYTVPKVAREPSELTLTEAFRISRSLAIQLGDPVHQLGVHQRCQPAR